MSFPIACIDVSDNKKIPLKEKGVVFYIQNSQGANVYIVAIDGCVYKKGSPGLRCDYAFYDRPAQSQSDDDLNRKMYLVELKGGSQIQHALQQLGSVVTKFRLCGKVVTCFLVYTRNPMASTETQNASKKFRDTYGVPVKFVKSGHVHVYS